MVIFDILVPVSDIFLAVFFFSCSFTFTQNTEIICFEILYISSCSLHTSFVAVYEK